MREALIAAGVEMARAGGPEAVVLREATRRAGVSPNAAYRHFADRQDLLLAVSAAALGMTADRMEAELRSMPSNLDPVVAGRLRLRAIGEGYIGFAREEPGLFRTAFSVPDDLSEAASADKAGVSGHTPFQLLGLVLDELVALGVMPPERRPGAELVAWSSVHGLGMLAIDGPLRGLDDATLGHAMSRLLDMVDRGL